MFRFSKIASIRLLMIAAQLLLIAFVVHWISLQYREQKMRLNEATALSFSEAREQVFDTILLRHFINPAMDSTTQYKFDFKINTDSMRRGFLEQRSSGQIKGAIPVLATGSSITVRMSDSSMPECAPGITKIAFADCDQQNVVLQGVKLFIHKTQDAKGSVSFTDSLISSFDTTSLKKIFAAKLGAISSKLKPVWIVQTDSTQKKSGKRNSEFVFYVNGKVLKAEVQHIQSYIIGKIYPQLIFALLLLLLTAASFIIAFRSLKSQIQLNAIRNDFVRNISHELKTPVATVKVALEALETFNVKADPVKSDAYIHMASQEIDRLELLINRVLSSSVQSDSSQVMQPQMIDLRQLVDEVLLTLQPRFEKEHAVIDFVHDTGPFEIMADRLHVQGVLLNLIDNSLKYTVKEPEIKIELSGRASEILLTVSDRGIGIPDEYLRKVFGKFFRVPTGDRHNVKGYGLGLSYASMVMKMHKGSITAAQREGGGCVFTVVFPTC